MPHLDEGTVHAWLDGELPSDEGARVEAHVAACEACAALVAEARGLIAASSRILSALDDVPGGVLPGATSPTGDPPLARPGLTVERGAPPADRAVQRARRAFYRNPQFAAAAAVLVMAVGTWTIWQRSTERDAIAPSRAPRETAVASPAVQRMDSAALRGATVPAPATAEARTAKVAADEAAIGKREGSASVAASADPGRRARPANTPDALKSATAAPAGAAADARRQAETDAALRRDRSNEAAPPAAPASTGALAQRVVTDSAGKAPAVGKAGAERKLAVSPDSVVAREASRVRGEVAAQRQLPDTGRARRAFADQPLRLDQVVVTGAAASVTATAGSSVAVVNACYDLARSAAALENRVPARIRLLGARGPTIGQRTLSELAVLGADPETGEWFWWVRGDRVMMLVRVEDNTVRYEVPASGVGAVDVRATAVRCPEE